MAKAKTNEKPSSGVNESENVPARMNDFDNKLLRAHNLHTIKRSKEFSIFTTVSENSH